MKYLICGFGFGEKNKRFVFNRNLGHATDTPIDRTIEGDQATADKTGEAEKSTEEIAAEVREQLRTPVPKPAQIPIPEIAEDEDFLIGGDD